MDKGAIAKFTGVFVSLLVIWIVNDLLLIKPCLNAGGTFIFDKGQCLLEDGSFFTTGWEIPLVFAYVVIGLSVSFSVSKLISKLIKRD